MPEPVHALILTSTGDDLDGVLGLFDRVSSVRLTHPNGWTCWRCDWHTNEGEDLRVAIAHVAVMEGVSSVSKFEDLRAWLRPAWLFHCGSAYPSKRPAVVFVTHLLTGERLVNTLDALPMRARVVLNELLTSELKKTHVYTSGVELLDADADRGSDLPTAMDDAIVPLLPLLMDARCLFLRGHDESTGAFDAAGVALRLLEALTTVHADNHPRMVPRGSVVDEATLALFDDVTVDHLAVRNFKNVSSLDLDLDRSDASTFGGRWLCLAGVNGAGKSAVLQSLVLGLLGPRYAAELGGASLQRMRRDLAGAPQDARIEVTVRLGDSRHVVPLPITARGATAVEGIDRATHERIWDGFLAVRCWKDALPMDTAARDRARAQLDRALTRGIVLMLNSRIRSVATTTGIERDAHFAWVRVVGPLMDRAVRALDVTAANALQMAFMGNSPEAFPGAMVTSTLERLFPCP